MQQTYQAQEGSWMEWFNQANVFYRQNQFRESAVLYEKALAAKPDLALAALGVARCHIALGAPSKAIEFFKQCLVLDPDNYSARLEQAHALRLEGRMEESVANYQQAIALQPTRFEAPLGLIRTLELLDHTVAAAEVVSKALSHLQAESDTPKRLTFLQRLGRYRMERGDLPSAFKLLRQALQLCEVIADTEEREGQINTIRLDLAEILLRDKQTEPAHTLLTQISHSNDAAILLQLARLSYRFNLHYEAVAVLQKRLALMPDNPEALLELAAMQAECWQLDEAEQNLKTAENLPKQSELVAVQVNELRGRIASKLGDAETTFRLREAWLNSLPEDKVGPQHRSAQAMTSLYCDFLSATDIADLHRDSFKYLGEGAQPRQSFDLNALKKAGISRRIRLGLVSADFHHQHPVNIFMQPVLRELDRSRFEVTMYYNGHTYDDQTGLAKSRVDRWVEATYFSDKQLIAKIRQDGLDVLVDLSGHTAQNRMYVFAQRVAPVQATYLGYPGSTGVPNIDCLLGDSLVTPVDQHPLYSERIATMSGNVFCYAPEVDYPYPNYNTEHASRPLTLGSFNNLTKVSPRTLKLWLQIHTALPQSRLLLKTPSFSMDSAQQFYLKKLADLGFDINRIELQGPVGLSDMMAQYEQLDIALDPIPYNGGTTTLQAMWMGVPVVCQLGHHFVSRMSASFMTRLGLSDWVANNDEDYVRIAVEKGQDRQALLTLKQNMRNMQLANPAWDPVVHTRSFEKCIEGMVRS